MAFGSGLNVHRVTGIILVILTTVLIAGFAFFALRTGKFPEIPTSVLVLLGIVASAYLVSKAVQASSALEIELQPVRAERKAIEERIDSRGGTQADVVSVIKLGLNQITEYYTINKSQARNTFTASMAAVIVGLIAIFVGIVLNYSQPQHTTVATLSALSGVLLQFIGGAYFYLYNRSLEQLNFFYETLVRLQDMMLAIQQVELLETAAQEKARGSIIAALIRSPAPPPRARDRKRKGNHPANADAAVEGG